MCNSRCSSWGALKGSALSDLHMLTFHSAQGKAVGSSRARSAAMSSSSPSFLNRERALLLLAGATAASVVPALWRRLQRRGVLPAAVGGTGGGVDETRSTTSSAGGGSGAYETRKAVDEYLQFHYGRPEDIMPYECGPKVGRAAASRGGSAWSCGGRVYMHDGCCSVWLAAVENSNIAAAPWV